MTDDMELPEWVRTLIDAEKEKSWSEGYSAGQRQRENDMKNFLEGRHW